MTGLNRLRAVLVHVGVFAAYVVASIGMTWPLSLRMRDHVLAAKWHHDAYTNTMILATRVLNALGDGAGGVYENFFFAPIDQTIVFNENLFGLSLLYAPFYLASGNPLFAYNQVLILSLALSGYGAYLLVSHLAGSRVAGFISGLAFAFCPYATFEIGRIQLVATAWVPLSLLCLHLAIERGRARYSLLFALCYAMQVGTCLYYAMFMLPLIGVLTCWLAIQHRRREKRFWIQTAMAGALCAALLALMIAPYFATRDQFALKRSESFARGYDGELSFLANVHVDNKLLTPLHHSSKDHGAHEEVAFPTFTMSLLALLALAGPLWLRLRGTDNSPEAVESRRGVRALVSVSVIGFAAAIGTAILLRTALAGLPVLALAFFYFRWSAGGARVFSNVVTLYLVLLLLSVLLFLGLQPLEVDGASMKGLYYYLHTYVPGFNGIRKVSRQAIIVMMMVAVVGGFGAAAIVRRWPRWQWLTLAVLATTLLLEVACVPMRLAAVPAEKTLPPVYRWLEQHRSEAPLAILPTHTGVRRFRGNPGLAMHNYLTVYHRHRTINGKSSWIPPVTHLFHRATKTFPTEPAKRLLQLLGVEEVVIHTGDMPRGVGPKMISELDALPEEYERVYRNGTDYVYRLKLAPGAPAPAMRETPELPVGAEPVHRWDLRGTASRFAQDLHLATDDRASTRWSTQGAMVPGDYFELRIPRPQRLVAIEIISPEAPFDVPAAYTVTAANGDLFPVTVAEQNELGVFRDQVLRPRSFVFRVVFPQGVVGDRVRITAQGAFADAPWSVQEAKVWVMPDVAAQ